MLVSFGIATVHCPALLPLKIGHKGLMSEELLPPSRRQIGHISSFGDRDPLKHINLKLLDGSIELLSEGDAVKLVLDCTIQTFANTVGLRMICLSSCVLNIIERQEELIVVRVLASAILCPPSGENSR